MDAVVSVTFKEESEDEDGMPVGPVWICYDGEPSSTPGWMRKNYAQMLAKEFGVELEDA